MKSLMRKRLVLVKKNTWTRKEKEVESTGTIGRKIWAVRMKKSRKHLKGAR